jgi:hypothetical protein
MVRWVVIGALEYCTACGSTSGIASNFSRNIAVRAGYRSKKSAQFAWVLLSRTRFDATGYVDGVWFDDAYGFRHIFRPEAAGKQNAVSPCSGFGGLPVHGAAGAAELAAGIGVQQKCSDLFETGKIGAGSSLPDAKGFEYGDFLGYFRDHFRRFVAVKLNGGESQSLRQYQHWLRSPVHENPYRSNKGRKLADYSLGSEWRNYAGAVWVKV